MFHIDFVFPHHMCVFPTTSCFREVRQNLIWALRTHFPFCLWWFLGREVMKTICPYKRGPPALSLASHWPRMTQLFLGLLWLRYQHLEEQCRSRPGDLWQRDQCNACWIGRWKSPNQLTFHMAVSTAVNMHCKETNYLTDWLTTWFSMKMVNEKLAGTLKTFNVRRRISPKAEFAHWISFLKTQVREIFGTKYFSVATSYSAIHEMLFNPKCSSPSSSSPQKP
jgi:hypothetical protein